jgi:hypothetical protein
MNPKEAHKYSGKAARKVKVDGTQIQEILRKINVDTQKKKVKKKSAKQAKAQKLKPEQRVHLAANSSCININAASGATIVSPGHNDLSTASLLAARGMLSPLPDTAYSKPITEAHPESKLT